MSDLHDLCKFPHRPLTVDYVEKLNYYLKNGIPATYTIEEAYNYTHGIDDAASTTTTTTTPLHIICSHVPSDASDEERAVVDSMVQILLEYGAGWCLTDIDNNTPGCILLNRGLALWGIYRQIVDAGVRAELLLRKVSEYDMEIIDDTDGLDHGQFGGQDSDTDGDDDVALLPQDSKAADTATITDPKPPTPPVDTPVSGQVAVAPVEYDDAPDAPSQNQQAFLNTKLEYRDGALVTEDRKDGVMMEWESDLMQLGCDLLFKGGVVDGESDSEINILNIGFGMGIIDTMINSNNPTKHYICEAHPDVLKKLRDDGWYEKNNVVILEGRWQDQLDILLSLGNVFFNGIYYDTFSEHYSDMLELFDYVVGLLKPHGVFSFFNGLGADRQVIYEVYKQLVEIDLSNYGLQCTFTEVVPPTLTAGDKSVWNDVKRSYWSCPVYYHPETRFIDL